MKKLSTVSLFAMIICFTACERAHNKTGGATRDSSASHGFSGPDTANGAGISVANSTGGSDTSTNGKTVTSPLADTAKPKKHN